MNLCKKIKGIKLKKNRISIRKIKNTFFCTLFFAKTLVHMETNILISIPKKIGNAAKRNKIRRRIKEALRLYIEKPFMIFIQVRLRKYEEYSWNAVKESIERFMEKLNALY